MKIGDDNFSVIKTKMLNWANQFNIFCMLDNNGYSFEKPSFECILAVGCKQKFIFSGDNDFEKLQKFYDENPSWLFGHLGYNASQKAYQQKTENTFGDGFFFEPEIILQLSKTALTVVKTNIDEQLLFQQIESVNIESAATNTGALKIVPLLTKEKYIEKVNAIKSHIKIGDCYELNFCQQFFIDNVTINPVNIYEALSKTSAAPFAALYKLKDNYCICASPERFLKKEDDTIISQPIKGTSKRSADESIDNQNKQHLLNSEKEKSENVMVVDLVRNDMSMVCKKNSVTVKELFGIYSFPQVHQMISTIQGKVESDMPFSKIIDACFPMGSMTGAPKQKVMQLIEQYEDSKRGLFSGSIGYISPYNDFDFNVVIRSIFYNKAENIITFFAGSGITFYSDAEQEYEECMAKIAALIKVLNA